MQLMCVTLSGAASAEAAGPDYWNVANVIAPDVLNMHKDASARSPVVAVVPADARGLKNRGCTGAPTFQQWMAMSAAERERSSRARWCRVTWAGTQGWVAGRFLVEGAPDNTRRASTKVGPWTIVCSQTPCTIEQAGFGAKRSTRLVIGPKDDGNAEISVVRSGLARQGAMTIHIDGEVFSRGPVAPLWTDGGRRLRMEADDLTAGLLRELRKRKTMVLTLPGEPGGVEFHLERLGDALRAIESGAK